MRRQWFRLELRVELAGEEPWMIGDFDDLNEVLIRRNTGNHQAVISQDLLELPIEFISMAMPLRNHIRFVNTVRDRTVFELRWISSQTHRTADGVDAEQIAEFVNHRIRRVRIELGAVGVL